jgi:cyanophycinase-like exopeptidase
MAAMLEAGKRGDVVVLRMDDTGGGYAEYFGDLGAHSVRELVFDPVGGNDQVSPERLLELRRVADAPWVRSVLEEAEVVFFAGGNQTKYFDVFYGTEVSRVLSDGAPRVIGGTSAGMHVMGKLVHTPRGPGNSVTSSQALTDPYIAEGEHSGTASLSFSDGLFSIAGLENIITDTHWSERSRLGRTLVFAARVIRDGLRPVGGFGLIACDESTAAVIGENGVARVFGTGSAFFFRPDVAPTQCEDNLPLEWPAGVPMVEIKGTAGGLGAFNVRSWTSVAPVRRVAVRGGIPFAL